MPPWLLWMHVRLVIRRLLVWPLQGWQHSFVEIDHEMISTAILSPPLIQEGQFSVSGIRICTILVNQLEDWARPVKVWLGKLTTLNMTPPALVAQLNAPSDWRPEGRGFNPRRGWQHSFLEIDHEIFSAVILSLPLIQGQLSVSGERMCTILVNRLED